MASEKTQISNTQTADLKASHLSAYSPAGLEPACYRSSNVLNCHRGEGSELYGSEEVIFIFFSQNALPRYLSTDIPTPQGRG